MPAAVDPAQSLHVLELATLSLDWSASDTTKSVWSKCHPELVALVHHGEVHRAERIGVPVQRRAAEDPADEVEQRVPLEQRPQRRRVGVNRS